MHTYVVFFLYLVDFNLLLEALSSCVFFDLRQLSS